MRISQGGVARGSNSFSFSFEGELIEASPGESIAAALISAKHTALRVTRNGESRGVFCGMGVCGECSVIVDGRPRRACMEMAAPNITVQRQLGLRSFPDAGESRGGCAVASLVAQESTRDVEVLVIGAGPAGLAAGRAAALSGAKVLLVDEREKAGGQYFKQPGLGFDIDETCLDAQFREGLTLYRSALAAGVEICFATTVWGAFHGPQVAVSSASGSQLINAQRVVVSPGAYERPVAFPGWTLPGVMTTGAAQTLLRAYQTAPGKRVLVAGNGPLNLQVARELSAAGAKVVAVVELSPRPSLRKLKDLLRMTVSSPGLVASGIGHLGHLLRARVPMFYQHTICEAQGDDAVQNVSIARVSEEGMVVAGTQQSFDVDAVCLGYGFLSQSEIPRALGAGDSVSKQWEPVPKSSDESGRSASAPEVFVVGDARGLGGSKIAQSQGELAGAQAAADLGYQARASLGTELATCQRELRAHKKFQESLWSLYKAPVSDLSLTDRDTVICRCESVTRGQIEDVLAVGVSAIGAVKRETRAGMGRCQGRYCANLLAQLSCQKEASLSEAELFFAPRPPFKPLSIADLAIRYDPEVAFDRSAGAARDAVRTELSGATQGQRVLSDAGEP